MTATTDTNPSGAKPPASAQVFWAWERLRIAYNLALVGVVLGWMCFSGNRLHPYILFSLPLYAVVANVCFCAGPVAEGYICLIGLSRRWARWMLFTGGTLLAAAAAVWEMNRGLTLGGGLGS